MLEHVAAYITKLEEFYMGRAAQVVNQLETTVKTQAGVITALRARVKFLEDEPSLDEGDTAALDSAEALLGTIQDDGTLPSSGGGEATPPPPTEAPAPAPSEAPAPAPAPAPTETPAPTEAPASTPPPDTGVATGDVGTIPAPAPFPDGTRTAPLPPADTMAPPVPPDANPTPGV